MQLSATTVSLTVDDVAASRDFFVTHFGYQVTVEADGFASLSHEGAAVDLVLLTRGTEVLPPDQRDQHAAGLILAFTVTGLEAEEKRLRAEGAPITLPLREEPWGERLFQTRDPNGVVVQLVEWVTPAEGAPGAEE
ncbi:VOC family protein [Streptomyces sp. 8N114]|uniref:VOC family protein n=1 Tax=Streptomyces sp. 8N114 TaxID=3457419 RepID=UPI003FD5FCCC